MPTAQDREPLSRLLYEGTADTHRAAEQTPYMRALFQGKLSREAYRAWLVRFHHVYTALEETTAALRDDPDVGGLYLPQLMRTEAIERDLAYFYGRDWRAALESSPATDAYVARLHRVRDAWPLGLVPHHWIRYGGYLHGGRMLARRLTSAYDLPDGLGTAFYAFPEIADNAAFLTEYHARMNAVPLRPDDAAALIAEGDHAFDANAAITVELGAAFGVR